MKLKSSFSQRRRGFTLTEILIVIAVLAVIMSIGYPSYQRLKGLASAGSCSGKLRQLGAAVNSYSVDHNLKLPILLAGRESKEEVPAPGEPSVMDIALLPYVNDEFAFSCPADHGDFYGTTGTSYFWNNLINGQQIGNMQMLGVGRNESGIPIMSDKENFHTNIGDEVNILYADGHVQKELQFIVDK